MMLKNMLNTFGTKTIAAAINFLMAILLSQYLGAIGKGMASLLLANIAIISLFNDFVGGPAYVYLSSRYNINTLLKNAYIWASISTLLLAYPIYHFSTLDPKYFIGFVLLSWGQSLMSIHINILIGRELIQSANFLFLIKSILLLAGFVCFIILAPAVSLSYYIFALAIAIYFPIFLSLNILNSAKQLDPENVAGNLWKTAFTYGAWTQIGNILQFFNYRISYYLLEFYQNTEQVGIYSNAVSIAEAIWLVSRSIAMVQYAGISKRDDEFWSIKITIQLLAFCTLFSIFLAVLLLLIPASFFTLIFGAEFMATKSILTYLLPGIIAMSMNGILSHYFSGRSLFYINTIASAIGLVVTVGLSVFWIPTLGMQGAALAASMAYFSILVVTVIYFLLNTKKYPQIWTKAIQDLRERLLKIRTKT